MAYRWPNCCPFCGTHVNRGGAGSRHGTFHCGNCHADYDVAYYGTYPKDREKDFGEVYKSQLEAVPRFVTPAEVSAKLKELEKNRGQNEPP